MLRQFWVLACLFSSLSYAGGDLIRSISAQSAQIYQLMAGLNEVHPEAKPLLLQRAQQEQQCDACGVPLSSTIEVRTQCRVHKELREIGRDACNIYVTPVPVRSQVTRIQISFWPGQLAQISEIMAQSCGAPGVATASLQEGYAILDEAARKTLTLNRYYIEVLYSLPNADVANIVNLQNALVQLTALLDSVRGLPEYSYLASADYWQTNFSWQENYGAFISALGAVQETVVSEEGVVLDEQGLSAQRPTETILQEGEQIVPGSERIIENSETVQPEPAQEQEVILPTPPPVEPIEPATENNQVEEIPAPQALETTESETVTMVEEERVEQEPIDPFAIDYNEQVAERAKEKATEVGPELTFPGQSQPQKSQRSILVDPEKQKAKQKRLNELSQLMLDELEANGGVEELSETERKLRDTLKRQIDNALR